MAGHLGNIGLTGLTANGQGSNQMLTRRNLLAGAGALGLGGLTGRRGGAQVPSGVAIPLPIPALQDARLQGGAFSLVAAEARHSFAPGRLATGPTYGFSSPFLGPVLRLHSGDDVQASVENRLPMATTSHWHGLLVPAWQDGGPHEMIRPGERWQPILEVDQAECTAWYHAHPHHDTGRQVYMGLAGMMIIEDGTGAGLGLPRTYGVDDLPIIMMDRLLDKNGQLEYRNFARERILGTRGDSLVVNGVIEPTATVPSGLVRLRLLDAANSRNFHLHFDDHRPFYVIATDGGYLPAPVALDHLTIAPGERYEIIVDFSDGRGATLMTMDDYVHGPEGAQGMGNLTVRGHTGVIAGGPGPMLHFVVDPALVAAASTLPALLVPMAAPDPASAIRRRRFTLDFWPGLGSRVGLPGGSIGTGGGSFVRGAGPAMGINGQMFDMDRIDFSVALGSREIWDVSGHMMPHPFHVHGATMRVLSLDGAPPPAHLAGEKDTVLLTGPAELLVQFDQPATHHHPFMIHCHILDHEDGGMMAQFITV